MLYVTHFCDAYEHNLLHSRKLYILFTLYKETIINMSV